MGDFVEVRGKSVEIAVDVAMKELGATDPEAVDVTVVQQPEKAVLGLFGGRDAIVRVSLRPQEPKKRRRRRRKKGGESKDGGEHRPEKRSEVQNRGREGQRGDGERRDSRDRQRPQKGGGRGQGGSDRKQERPKRERERSAERSEGSGEEREVSIEEQIPVVEEFLSGLVGAFGLDGSVDVTADSDVIVANVVGSQTEAMVGPRGSVIESIHELTKTVLHRRTQSSARVRLDIAGYAERRRQALSIYANQLIAQVMEEGGEVMLEPMSAADRKVIHDAVAAHEGVRSYSEGQAPERYVVISSEVSAAQEGDGGSEEE